MKEAHKIHNVVTHGASDAIEDMTALGAVLELASLLEDCENLSDLKKIRTNLKQRLQAAKKNGSIDIESEKSEDVVNGQDGQEGKQILPTKAPLVGAAPLSL